MAKKEIISAVAEGAKIAINPTGYLLNKIIESTSGIIDQVDEATIAEIDTLRVESERQELQTRIAEAQARVAQEVAIAHRIETAEEVEMEEFYDYSGSGSVGVDINEAGINIGAKGEGKRVSKRIYRFKGNTTKVVQT